MLALLSAAHAATLSVSAAGGADFSTINDAIDAASSGDTIAVAPGTYSEAINYDGKSLRIVSDSGASVTILDAGGSASWAIRIRSGEGEGTALSGFTVRNDGYSGAWLSGSTALFEDVVFEDLGYTGSADNANLDDGGAIHVVSGTYTFSGVTISGCRAKSDGGALFIDEGDITLSDSTIDGCTASGSGGAIWAGGGSVTLDSASLVNNTAGTDGGAIATSATLTIIDSSLQNNQTTDAASDGGAIHLSSADATITGTVLADNAARDGSGGAIWAEGSTSLALSSSEFSRNTANRNGGHIGLSALDEVITITDTTLESGRASASGGGLSAMTNANVVLSGVSLVGNQAGEHGGGAYFAFGSTLEGEDCLFEGNTALEGSGGGLFVLSVSGNRGLTLSSTTFSSNAAKHQGGGLSSDSLGLLSLSGVTFTGNAGLFEGTIGGGLYASDIADLWVHQSRFTANEASIGAGGYIFGAPGSWQNNIFWENRAEVAGALSLSQSATSLTNNTFAGNFASREASALALYDISGGLTNNIFSHHDGDAVYVYDAATITATELGYNGWFANTADLSGEPWQTSSTAISADPRYASWPPPTPFSHTSFVLSLDSELVNAGDPKLLDPDSTQSDVGAWGGPELLTTDADGDGYTSAIDCNDDDSSVYPGAAETWYDGEHSDCVPDDDYDADGDGAASEAYGGTDCDDTDPEITADCEPADTGAGEERGCQGCSGGGGGAFGLLGLWLVGLITSRARRSS